MIKVNRVVINNIISLGFVQGLNYVIPLISVPYLTRVLGMESFGKYIFATSIILLLNIVVEYGFNLSATKEISQMDDTNEISKKFILIIYSKIILSLAVFCVLLLFVFITTYKDSELLFAAFIYIIGQIFIPFWYFQGIQKLKHFTIVNFFSKISSLIAIFIFVKTDQDELIAILCDSIGSLAGGLLSTILVLRIQKRLPYRFDLKQIFEELRNTSSIFISRLQVALYWNINTPILGLLTNNVVVGEYGISEKIFKAVNGLLNPINQAIYPFLSKEYLQDKKKFERRVKKVGISLIGINLVIALIMFFCSGLIVEILIGEKTESVIKMVMLFAIAVVFFPLNSFLTNILIIKNKELELNKALFKSVIVNFIVIFPMIFFFKSMGLITTIIIIQVFLFKTLTFIYFHHKPEE